MADAIKYESKDFPAPDNNHKGFDAITTYGPGIVTEITNCVFDFRSGDTENMDECLDCVDGAIVKLKGCIIIGGIKAILAGNGDHPENDAKYGRLEMEDCVLIGNGRRCPEAQDGVIVTMKRCWIHNWGERFDVRAFGAWAHRGAKITAEECLFTQSGTILSLGIKNTIVDLANHIGQAWNDHSKFRLLPGVARGLTADTDGEVSAHRCYRNKKWIAIDGCDSFIESDEALSIAMQIESNCRDLRPWLGLSVIEMFIDVAHISR